MDSTLRLEIHLFDHSRGESRALKALLVQGNDIMASLDALTAAVARNTDVDQSAMILLQGLKKKLDEAIASGDPAQVQKLADDLAASNQALADAVAQNTPAENP